MAAKFELDDIDFGTENTQVEAFPENQIVKIPLDLLDIGDNIRDVYEDADLLEIGMTIKERGQIEPAVVYKNGDRYTIIAGSRRFKACSEVGLKTLDCIIKEKPANEMDRIIIQAIENEHRRDMSSRERENYINRLIELGMSRNEICKALHKNKSWISMTMQAHEFAENVKDRMDEIKGEVSTHTAYKASKLSSDELNEAFENTKKEGNTKEAFKKNVEEKYNSKKKKPKEEIIENEDDYEVSAFEEITDETDNMESGERTVNVNYSLTINEDDKRLKIETYHSEDESLDDFVKRQIENYYMSKGYTIE